MKLSIIVPVYNSEKWLDKCLRSLINQSIEKYEVIVINDGSMDNSDKIIDKFQSKYPKLIKSKTIKHSGVGAARNVGLKLAKGEYIGFVDSDDYVRKDMYKRLYKKAIDENADIVTCGYYNIIGDKVTKKHVNDGLYGKNIKLTPQIFWESLPFCWVHIFKRKLIKDNDILFDDYRIFEDLLFTYKCYKHANKIVKVNSPLYYYVKSNEGNSLTQSFTDKYFDIFNVIKQLDKYYESFIDKEYITFIAIKHIYIRFNTNVKKSELKVKNEFINASIDFLNEFDSTWKNNFYFIGNKRFYYFTKKYWLLKSFIFSKRG